MLRNRSVSLPFSWLASITLACVLAGQPAMAADHLITSGTSTVNCKALGVKPGDTITIGGTTRGPLAITNCTGAPGKHITVRNDTTETRQLSIRKTSTSSGGFVFRFTNNKYVTVDGTGKWSGAPSGTCGINKSTLAESRNTCGIKVVQVSKVTPAAYIQIDGHSSFMTFRGIEIQGMFEWDGTTGGGGQGIQLNDHQLTLADFPGSWFEDFRFENMYLHELAGSGLYIGANLKNNGFPLRNIEIAYLLAEDMDGRGLTIKAAMEGKNSIHHNHVYRAGIYPSKKGGGFGHCITFYEGGGSIHDNLAVDCGENGIDFFTQHAPSSKGPFPATAYNNVIVNTGLYGPIIGAGIVVGRQDTADAVFIPKIYNNTVVNSNAGCIALNPRIDKGGEIRDNICAGRTKISSHSSITKSNNRTGTIASLKFANALERDYYLTAASPARNAGTTNCPSKDHVGTPRPQNDSCDQGAFEFVDGQTNPKPVPPPNPPRLVVDQ